MQNQLEHLTKTAVRRAEVGLRRPVTDKERGLIRNCIAEASLSEVNALDASFIFSGISHAINNMLSDVLKAKKS